MRWVTGLFLSRALVLLQASRIQQADTNCTGGQETQIHTVDLFGLTTEKLATFALNNRKVLTWLRENIIQARRDTEISMYPPECMGSDYGVTKYRVKFAALWGSVDKDRMAANAAKAPLHSPSIMRVFVDKDVPLSAFSDLENTPIETFWVASPASSAFKGDRTGNRTIQDYVSNLWPARGSSGSRFLVNKIDCGKVLMGDMVKCIVEIQDTKKVFDRYAERPSFLFENSNYMTVKRPDGVRQMTLVEEDLIFYPSAR